MSVPKRKFKISHTRLSSSGSRTSLCSSHIRLNTRWCQKKEKAKEDAGGQPQNTHRAYRISLPRDGLIRAVASVAAKERRRSDRIEKFDRVLLAYARLQMNQRHGYVIEDYIFTRLQEKAKNWKRGILEKEDEIMRSLWRRHDARKKELAALPHALTRSELESMAEEIFRDVEADLVRLARSGNPVRRGTRNGYSAVRALLGIGRMNRCFLILDGKRSDPAFRIKALKTPAEFSRSTQNRLRSKRRYSNRPPCLRYV